MSRDKIRYPFGAADVQSKSYAATIAATVENSLTELTIGQLTGNATLNLTVDTTLPVGSELVIRASADNNVGGRVLTPGTKMTGAAVTLAASKSTCLVYYFDGTNFVHKSTMALS